ncbi:MAG TPA: hypothetical protein VIK18_09205 [Pirellulales bacterium]
MSKKSKWVRNLAAMGCVISALALMEFNIELEDLKIGSNNWRFLVGELSMLPMFALLGGGVGVVSGRFLQGVGIGAAVGVLLAAVTGLCLWLDF